MSVCFDLKMSETLSKDYGFYPYNKLRRFWEFTMYIVSNICLWEIPLQFFFNTGWNYIYFIYSAFVDILFLADIYIVMHTGILEAGVIKLDKKSVRGKVKMWRYIIYWLCTIPIMFFGLLYKGGSSDIFRYLVIFKLIRLFRLYDSYKTIRGTLAYINNFTKLLTLVCNLFTVAHFSACVFWYTGYREIPMKSWLVEAYIVQKDKYIQYFHTLYYITTTILTIGYGDLHPYTFPEVCVVVCVEIIGVFFYNFVVSNLVSIIADPSRSSFIKKYLRIYSAFKYRKVKKSSKEDLMTYYEYVWERNRDRTDFYETIEQIPEELQKKVLLSLHIDVFNKLKAFEGVSDELFKQIAMSLKLQLFAPGDILIKAGKPSSGIFLLTEGIIEIKNAHDVTTDTIDCKNGCVLGEQSILENTNEKISAIAKTYVESFQLLKEDYDEIVLLNPQIQMHFKNAKVK